MGLNFFDLFPGFQSDAGECIRRLQVHPEFSRCAKKCTQQHRHVCAYAALFGRDIADSLRGNSNRLGKTLARNTHGLQEFMLEDVSRMGRPSCWSSSFVRHFLPLVIIGNLNVVMIRSI
jgi:hypothetical protein